MMKIFGYLLWMLLLGIPAYGQCLVSDPTGTPLNVRQIPNGRIVTSLKRGTAVAKAHLDISPVFPDKTATDSKGNVWQYIHSGSSIEGWVLADFLFCDGTTRDSGSERSDDLTATEMREAKLKWAKFLPAFKTAIRANDRRKLIELGFPGQDFDSFNKNKSFGFNELGKVVTLGRLDIFYRWSPNKYGWSADFTLIDLRQPCGNQSAEFMYVQDQWKFRRYYIQGCGH